MKKSLIVRGNGKLVRLIQADNTKEKDFDFFIDKIPSLGITGFYSDKFEHFKVFEPSMTEEEFNNIDTKII